MDLSHKVIEAKGFWRWLIIRLDLVALVMPWRRVYILKPWLYDPVILRHEAVHIEQIARDGAIVFSVKYLWWLARYGYRRNPYEIEAYSRDGSE